MFLGVAAKLLYFQKGQLESCDAWGDFLENGLLARCQAEEDNRGQKNPLS